MDKNISVESLIIYDFLLQICDVDSCLKRHLLAVCPEQQRLRVNLHPSIPLLIRETDLMIKMDLPIPMICLTLYSKQDHFNSIKDHLKFLIEDFLIVVGTVKLEIRPLFVPHLIKLTDIIAAGLKELTWVSSNWKEFVDRANDAIKKFKVLVLAPITLVYSILMYYCRLPEFMIFTSIGYWRY